MKRNLILSFCLTTFALVFLFQCATDPGSTTPTTGSSVFRYPGQFRVVINSGQGRRNTSVVVGLIAIGDNDSIATEIEPDTSWVWPNAVSFLNCSDATLVSSSEYTFYKIYNYSVGCSIPASGLSASVSVTVTKVGVGSTTTTGTGNSNLTSHTIFVTSSKYNATTIASLSNADSICASNGAAGSLTTSLSGTWRAILSDSSTNAKDRLSLTSGAPVLEVTGTTVVSSSSALWSGTLTNSFGLDASGNIPLAPSRGWTGTNADGTYSSGGTCTDWTSTAPNGTSGFFGVTDSTWLNGASMSCNSAFHLYCINSNN